MKTRPDISVVVPCYNTERYLKVCLESLAVQKTPEIEFLLIDDGSTDATGALLDIFAEQEPRAHVMHLKNRGVSAARNTGIDMARGSYIAFVDSDDALEDGALAKLYQAAIRNHAEIQSANHTLFDMNQGNRVPVEIEPVIQQPSEIVREIIHMHRIYNNLWNKLYAASLFQNGPRLDERVRIGEDALLNMQLYMRAERVAHEPACTYVYRIHKESAMSTMGRYREAHQPMLMAMNELLIAEGVKEEYFRDFLQSAVWVDEKEAGIREAMSRFNTDIRPKAVSGVREEKLSQADRRLYRIVESGLFPQFYYAMRVKEKLGGKRWGIRR